MCFCVLPGTAVLVGTLTFRVLPRAARTKNERIEPHNTIHVSTVPPSNGSMCWRYLSLEGTLLLDAIILYQVQTSIVSKTWVQWYLRIQISSYSYGINIDSFCGFINNMLFSQYHSCLACISVFSYSVSYIRRTYPMF